MSIEQAEVDLITAKIYSDLAETIRAIDQGNLVAAERAATEVILEAASLVVEIKRARWG